MSEMSRALLDLFLQLPVKARLEVETIIIRPCDAHNPTYRSYGENTERVESNGGWNHSLHRQRH